MTSRARPAGSPRPAGCPRSRGGSAAGRGRNARNRVTNAAVAASARARRCFFMGPDTRIGKGCVSWKVRTVRGAGRRRGLEQPHAPPKKSPVVFRRIASSIFGVRRPVYVFCWLTWYEAEQSAPGRDPPPPRARTSVSARAVPRLLSDERLDRGPPREGAEGEDDAEVRQQRRSRGRGKGGSASNSAGVGLLSGGAQRTAARDHAPRSARPSSRETERAWFAKPARWSAAKRKSPEESPVKTRPVRLPPCAAGARPTTRSRAAGIAEAGHRARPVALSAEAARRVGRRRFAPRDEARTGAAGGDLAPRAARGSPPRVLTSSERRPSSRPSADCRTAAATFSPAFGGLVRGVPSPRRPPCLPRPRSRRLRGRGGGFRLLGGLAHRLRGLGACLPRFVRWPCPPRRPLSRASGFPSSRSRRGSIEDARARPRLRPAHGASFTFIVLLHGPRRPTAPGRRWNSSRKAARKKYDDAWRNATDQPTSAIQKPRLENEAAEELEAGLRNRPAALPRAPRS